MPVTRRQFLTYLGAGNAAALAGARAAGAAPAFAPARGGAPKFFTPTAPSAKDELRLPDGFRGEVVIAWGDPLGSKAPDGTPELFGFNNDFLAYFPIDALAGGSNSGEGLLWVNHEYPGPVFVSGYTKKDLDAKVKKTPAQVEKERLSVGGSVVHVKRTGGRWGYVRDSKYNRRLTAAYPEIAFSGPAAAHGKAVGTLAGCSGGRTPWHTALSCEENYPDYNSTESFGYRWSDVPELKIDEVRYGWVVEVDPFGELPPVKHTALGRFKHENAAVRVGPSGRLVVYMGDDEADQHLYKFVSERPVKAGVPRAEQRKVLEGGTLYAANLEDGKWVALRHTPANAKKIKESKGYDAAVAAEKKSGVTLTMDSQADVLTFARAAARGLGATPLDRCEDCDVAPDGSVYVALTNSTGHGNFHGHILRLVEDNDDPEGESFRHDVFLTGSPRSGLSCPDNLAFDPRGNLWVVCDMSSGKIPADANKRKRVYEPFGNNGVFVVPTAGRGAGDAFQFASGPVECEITGPCFTDDGSTLFLSVQHPGEESPSAKEATSHWPDGGDAVPRPAVVAVSGFRW
jgi:uncharacterized protein